MKPIAFLLAFFTLPVIASAQNIDLSTLPTRDTVQLTIYNNEDLTLVRETRVLTFKKGENRLQFSWANTLIDPTSVELQFKAKADQLSLVDTTFPHDKPQMLYWNIASDFDGQATLEISYFTSGISWTADYVMIVSPGEDTAKLTGYVTVKNRSGEDYEDAQVRLVVGHINLVEKIAELARRGIIKDGADRRSGRFRAQREMVGAAEAQMDMAARAPSPIMPSSLKKKDIVKQGLSEYFIFTVGGRETVPNGWSKRLESFTTAAAPVEVVYRYRPRQYGYLLVKLFLVTNNQDAKLGTSPLPNGTFRIFRKQADDAASESLSYLGQRSVPYIPIGEEAELVLGVDPKVTFETRPLRAFRDRIFARMHRPDVIFQVDGGGRIRIEPRATVIGWDQHTTHEQRVRNNTGRPIKVEVRRHTTGDTVFVSRLNPKKQDANTAEYTTTVQPGELQAVRYELIERTGHNRKSSRVEIQAGDPAAPIWE